MSAYCLYFNLSWGLNVNREFVLIFSKNLEQKLVQDADNIFMSVIVGNLRHT